MSLYKLYCQFNIKKTPVYNKLFDIKHIRSTTPFYFGLNIDINTMAYSVFEKQTKKVFRKNRVEQFIVTENKFERVVENANSLNLIIKNMKLNFYPEEYECLEKHLFRQDISNEEILCYLNDFKEQGAVLKSLSLNIKGQNETIYLYNDGCVYLSNDKIAGDPVFSIFLEYLLTGRKIK